MSSYLPVLLVSVSTNAIPDDSSLTTLPRGQVDYLSHNWEEEDVWRSWRNMTKQKNEIANGMRLENASWRTWWKQRNKLKTVSPETLNWLKDSDVTWLYGPLHTAVEWSPPPRPAPVETEHKPSSAQDRLDLSEPKHKSILKYRSISELLTSDLPSPLFSPAESENEEDRSRASPKPTSDDSAEPEAEGSSAAKRPSLPHIKSDTHIARWGPSRVFRKDSPPRVEPPGASSTSQPSDSSYLSPNHVSDNSKTNVNGYFNGGDNSSSNSTSPSPRAGHSELSGHLSHGQAHKKKHITFNTFVEQCIAIEKPKPKGKLGALGFGGFEDDEWYEGSEAPGDDDGYDEDGEDGFDGDWGLNECAIGTDSDSDYNEDIFVQDEEEEDDDEGVIEMRSSRKNNTKRSKSKLSDSSSSTTTSSADSYSSSSTSSRKPYSTPRKPIPAGARRRRRSGEITRVNLPRRKSSSASHGHSSSDKDHVTIAPIAPTILKTGSSSWDGFGVHPPYHQRGGSGVWMEGFGDEGYSDDGGVGPKLYGVVNKKDGSESDGVNTPVELVYMPPTGRYGGSRLGSPANASPNASASNVNLIDDSPNDRKDAKDAAKEIEENGDKVYHHQQAYFSMDDIHPAGANGSVPIVVRTPPAVNRGRDSDDEAEEDAYDYFGGSDLGGDYASKRASLRRKDRTPSGGDLASSNTGEGPAQNSSSNNLADTEKRNRYRDEEPAIERESRSRSRSRSRTPSPSYVPTSSTPAISVPGRSSASSPQPNSGSSLLSPPSRDSPQVSPSTSRGRSSQRTSPSSLSDRERSSHGSPLGSLSPEGSSIGVAYSAYANGRGGGDRERDSGRGRDSRNGERGRDKTERKLSHSLSPDVVGSVPTSPSTSPSRPIEGNVQTSSLPWSSAVSTVSSSSSSSSTVMPSKESTPSTSSPIPIPLEIRDDDDLRLPSTNPTPANSPIISMSSAAHVIAQMDDKTNKADSKTPLNLSEPHISSPKVISLGPASLSNERPSVGHTRTASGSLQKQKESGREGEGGVMGKAVGIVSSAGAYLGFWNNGANA